MSDPVICLPVEGAGGCNDIPGEVSPPALPLDPLPETPTALDCPPLTVPGWLDQNGNPTSCVSNHPCPGFDATTCLIDDSAGVTTTIEPAPLPDVLAETGPVDGLLMVFLVACLLMVTGFAVWTRRPVRGVK